MAKMIAIGVEQFALVFGALGFEMHVVDPPEFLETLESALGDPDVGLVVCGESSITAHDMHEFRALMLEGGAAVVVLPDQPEPHHTGRELMRQAIEAAAGVDLLTSVQEESEEEE